MISPPEINLTSIAPELFIACSAIALFLLDAVIGRDKIYRLAAPFSLAVIVVACFLINTQGRAAATAPVGAFAGMIVLDGFAVYFNYLIAMAAAGTIVMSRRFADGFELNHTEFYVLILFSTVGMMLMAAAADLLSLFLALEIMSISIYILVGFVRSKKEAHEASFKYFTLGAFASALFVFGSALVYGQVGSTQIAALGDMLQRGSADPLLLMGIALILGAFFFKVSGAPFHMWTPDVYQAAPLPVTGFMSVGVKIAAFAGLVRIMATTMDRAGSGIACALYVLALLTLLIGNLAALPQRNLKRLLAYSSIAHVGYMVLALLPESPLGFGSILFYLFTYLIVNLGVFAILIAFSSQDRECATLDDIRGLGRRHPFVAVFVGVLVFSLAGIPPTAGFMGKLALFSAAVKGGYIGLTVVAVLASAVSLFYYLKILVAMLSAAEPGHGAPAAEDRGPCIDFWAVCVGGAAAAIVLIVGILPGSIIEWSSVSALTLF